MATLQPLYTGTLTVSTTELSLITGTSTLGASSTAASAEAVLDLSALTAGDAVRVRIKRSVLSTGTQRVAMDATYAGPLAAPIVILPLGMPLYKWDVTVTKVGGVDRSIDYSIGAVA